MIFISNPSSPLCPSNHNLVCVAALWPSKVDESRSLFVDAVQAATCALALNPEEGCWRTLYGHCLPWAHPDKGTLLLAGYDRRLHPFTVVCYTAYLAHRGQPKAVERASVLSE